MAMLSLCNLFSRVSLSASNKATVGNIVRNVSSSNALFINVTPCLYAEPLKKRKRLDPSILKGKEDRKKRKIAKAIRQREKLSLNLKPVEELLIPHNLLREKTQRTREPITLSPEVIDERARVMKSWTRYRHKQQLANSIMIDRLVYAQQKALDELRLASPELYEMAISFDARDLPRTIKGPSVTPPIKGYQCPDGDYIDVSFKWE